MLFLFIKFLYIFILSFLYGHTLRQFFAGRQLFSDKQTASFSITALTGLFTICILSSYLTLLMPLGAMAQGLLLAGGVACFIYNRQSVLTSLRSYVLKPYKIAFFGIAVLYAVYLSAQQSFTYDEGLYYAQFIKWMQHYQVVPGLANLHVRFGFNSHWHVLAAVFNFSWLTGAADNHINGVLYLLVMLYLLPSSADSPFIRFLKVGLLVLINMPQVCVYNIIAPAADLPVFYIGCLIVVVWLEGKDRLFLLLAPLFLVTVKVSAIPVLLITAILLVREFRLKAFEHATWIIGASLLILAPWIIRNIMLTGYLVFPMELPDMFHLGWKVPLSIVHATHQDINAFAFYRTADVARFTSESFIQRYITWFTQHLRIYDKVLLLFAVFSPVVVFFRRRSLPADFLPVYIFLLLGCCFWFLQAPDPRFAYGYLAPLFVITVALAAPFFNKYIWVVCLVFVLILQAGTVLLYQRLHKSFITEKIIQDVPHSFGKLPVPYTSQPVDSSEQPFHLYIPLNTELCWDNPLPCADHMPKGVKMRGADLGAGFIHE